MDTESELDGIIFFKDPLGKNLHEPDVLFLMLIFDVHNVAIATNPATAKMILTGLSL
jgi:methylglyoxal synthase